MPAPVAERTFTSFAPLSVRAETVNEDRRSVEATVATDHPVAVFDYERFEIIDEILVGEGGSFPSRMPLLDSHMRSSVFDVYGSGAEFSQRDGSWAGVLLFDDDDQSLRAFKKVKNRHVNDVSIGYRVLESFTLLPGESRMVGSKTYKAGERALRVATKWSAKEVSLAAIGADEHAKIRSLLDAGKLFSNERELKMNPQLRAYLESIGLDAKATEQQAIEFRTALTGDQLAESKRIEDGKPKEPATGQRSEPTQQQPATPVVQIPQPDTQSARSEGMRIERERQTSIRDIAGGLTLPSELVSRSIDEGHTVEQFRELALNHVRESRGSGVVNHASVDASQDVLGRALPQFQRGYNGAREANDEQRTEAVAMSMVLAARMGGGNFSDPVNQMAAGRGQGQYGAVRVAESSPAAAILGRACDQADTMGSMSLAEVFARCLEHDGHRVTGYGAEAVVSAMHDLRSRGMSSSTLSAVFTTSMYASLLASYNSLEDTTEQWTRTTDVANFQQQERARVLKGGKLAVLKRNATADHVAYSDKKEVYKIARFASQFAIDEQDILDDTLNAMESFAPSDMGQAARELRADLVYSILLANAAMSDSVALFHASHSNLTTSAPLSRAAIQSMITRFNTQTENGRLLSKGSGYALHIPEALLWSANQFVNSEVISNDSGAGNKNTLLNKNITLISDGRLDNGVTDPVTGTSYAGSATTWFGSVRDGRHTIEVAYRRGTNRQPLVRPLPPVGGAYFIGWDINLDIGAKALDWLGMQKQTA